MWVCVVGKENSVWWDVWIIVVNFYSKYIGRDYLVVNIKINKYGYYFLINW